MKQELIAEYKDLLPAMPPDQWRRVRGEQEIIVRYEPEQALATLPSCCATTADRERLVTLVQRLLADERVQRAKPSTEQLAMIENIGETLSVGAARRAAAASARRAKRPQAQAAQAALANHAPQSANGLTPWNARTRSTSGCSSSASRCRRRPRPSRIRATRARCAARSMRRAFGSSRRSSSGRKRGSRRSRSSSASTSAGIPIVDAPYSEASAAKAVELVREGKAEALMKGSLHTDELMGAVVRREAGLRTARRISHCFVMDVPSYPETLIVTDAAINIAPTMEDKVHIIQNAIDLAPRAALCRSARRDPVGDGDGQSEGAVDGRGGRAVQDGRPRPDHRRRSSTGRSRSTTRSASSR